jgi:hypothetical protein
MPDYHIVHVPQGRGARLGMPKEVTGIKGLYTDGFSSCMVILAVTQHKAVLIHADFRTSIDKIVEELKWVDGAASIAVFYREAYRHLNAEHLIASLKTAMPAKPINEYKVPDAEDGILVSFFERAGKNGIRVHRLPVGKKPDHLIYHPKEQLFLAAQKAEQIIGLRNIHATKQIVVKDVCIFDAFLWAYIDERDLHVRQDNPLTKEEMQQFKAEDDYVMIASKLKAIVQEAKQVGITIGESDETFVMPVAFWLEGLFHGFDADMLFRRNISALLDKSRPNSLYKLNQPENEQDAAAAEKLFKLTTSEPAENWLLRCKELMDKYAVAPQSEFKKYLLSEFRIFQRHHQERCVYRDASLANEHHIKRAKKIAGGGVKSMRKKNYGAAKNLFSEALRHCLLSCDMSNLILVSALFNYARADQRLGNADFAKSFMSRALKLSRAFDPDNRAQHEKIEGAISECEAELVQHPVDGFAQVAF